MPAGRLGGVKPQLPVAPLRGGVSSEGVYRALPCPKRQCPETLLQDPSVPSPSRRFPRMTVSSSSEASADKTCPRATAPSTVGAWPKPRGTKTCGQEGHQGVDFRFLFGKRQFLLHRLSPGVNYSLITSCLVDVFVAIFVWHVF